MSPRHKKPRMCGCPFGNLKGHIFKPSGIPMSQLEHITIYRDELEVLSLCDFEDMTQEEAGRKMGASRGTVRRLLMSGRKKLVEAVVSVKALIFEPETNMQN
jgi:predicted DNA-binding protein (UPF0251 family)